jgi:hypothetical protein
MPSITQQFGAGNSSR